MNLFWPQGIAIIPHVIIQAENNKSSQSRSKEGMVKKEKKHYISNIFLHELIKITQNFLEVADFPTGTKKRMLTDSLHSLNVLVP